MSVHDIEKGRVPDDILDEIEIQLEGFNSPRGKKRG